MMTILGIVLAVKKMDKTLLILLWRWIQARFTLQSQGFRLSQAAFSPVFNTRLALLFGFHGSAHPSHFRHQTALTDIPVTVISADFTSHRLFDPFTFIGIPPLKTVIAAVIIASRPDILRRLPD